VGIKSIFSHLKRRPRIGVALSGGGARGLAHIGVLKVLDREHIPIDCLAGTSMGGIIAAGYAAGMSPTDLEEEAIATSQVRQLLRLVDPGLPNAGLLHGKRLLAYFERHLGQRTFAELELPLALVAVDLNTRREVALNEGSVALALRATTAVPGIFTPVEIDGQELVDGGLLDNLPVDAVQNLGAEIVIAVDVRLDPSEPYSGLIGEHRWLPEGLVRTINILDKTIISLTAAAQEKKNEQHPADVLIHPRIPSGVNILMGYGRAGELITIGERATEAALLEIRKCINPRFH